MRADVAEPGELFDKRGVKTMRQAIRSAVLTIASLVVLGIPVVLATPQAASAATACTRVGNIQVTDTDNNTVVGFVSKTWNSFGEFVVTTTPSDYLSVQVTDGAQTAITALNGQNASFPLVGAIQGFASSSPDLGAGSFNYAYLGGTTSTAPGATPQGGPNAFTNATGIGEDIESAIWTDAPGTPGALLTPQWINTDSSHAPTHLMDITGILVVTGDTTAFQNTFGPASNVALNLAPTAPPSGPCSTTTTLSPTASAPAGTPVTFTATIASALGAGAMTGTVSFTSDGTPITGCTAQAPSASPPFTATCTTSALTVAGSPHSIVATFAGDANYQTSTSPAVSQTITPPPTTTTLSASPPSPSTFGQPVTFTATVTPGDGGGTVAFKDGAATIAGCASQALSGSGPYTATCTTSTLAVGPHSIVAAYSGDPGFTPSTSTALPYTVNQAATTTTLAAAPASPSVFGQSVTFTATVTGGDGGGTVAFTDGAATLTGCGAKALAGSGPYTATCTTSTLAVGAHSIKATYSGDVSFAGGVSAALPYTVAKAATTTTLAASPASPSVFGQSVTFTATVAAAPPGAGTPTGTVAFTDGATTLTGCGAKALAGSGPYTATCTTSTLAVGAHSIKATYSGDANFAGSASAALPYTVGQAATTTTLSASPAGSSNFGQAVTFTATVAAASPGAGTPTGSVAFTVDGTAVGSAALSASGQATLTTSSLSAGPHVIAATYSGSGNFLSSNASLPYSVTCAVTITGTHSSTLIVTTSTCVSPHANITGAILVSGAGSLDLEGATVGGGVSSNGGSGTIRICGSSTGGAISIKNQTALVIVGDPGDAACAPNVINGALLLEDNTGGVEAINNTERGLSASGNSGPGPFPGDPTTISGNHS
jgi:hypothetical protein